MILAKKQNWDLKLSRNCFPKVENNGFIKNLLWRRSQATMITKYRILHVCESYGSL